MRLAPTSICGVSTARQYALVRDRYGFPHHYRIEWWPCLASINGLWRPHVTVCSRNTDARRTSSLTPLQVAKAYNFPPNKGANQTIALIELGGGFNSSDLKTYWSKLGLPAVNVTAIGVNGATNSPSGDPESADGEVTLDIQVAGASCACREDRRLFRSEYRSGFLRGH